MAGTRTFQDLLDEARERGASAGKARHEAQEALPEDEQETNTPGWLSGECAGESMRELLGDLFDEAEAMGETDGADEEIAQSYEDGADTAYYHPDA